MSKPILRPRNGSVGCDAFKVSLHRCAYCPAKQVVPGQDLPGGWGDVGGKVACDQCVKMAEVLK